MRWLRQLGMNTRASWRSFFYVLAFAVSVVVAALRPAHWRSTVRNVLARQILFTGYQATRFISVVALLVGISVVVQVQVWTAALGQKALLGPILVMVIIRELGPLLTSFIVIARSGTAMATELASMRVLGETHVLDGQGIDPFIYLILPRAVGAAISVFCLTVIFIGVSILAGFFSGLLLGANTGTPWQFFQSVFGAIRPADVFNVIAKTWLPGLLMGCICCIEGLSIRGMATEVPQAASRAVVKSIMAMFLASAFVSILTYL
ncbi:MAG TPA: ABC transporter permease [Kiritimatiellia bacterium]|nr:ABC transporter permease [Kiritimatiellia bacterium]